MGRERRAADRFARRLDLRYWRRGNPQPLSGFSTNVSASGMFLATTQVLQPGERLRVELVDPNGGAMIEGQVVRVHRVTLALRHVDQPGAGVRFLPPEELVAAIVPAIRARVAAERSAQRQAADGRSAPATSAPPAVGESAAGTSAGASPDRGERDRVAVSDAALAPGDAPRVVIPVVFAERSSFLSVYHRDLATGGLFVSTDVAASLHQKVVVELVPPPPVKGTLRFAAEVVRRYEPEAAIGPGRNLLAGVGLRFLDPERVRAELEPVIAELRRSAGGP